jgi:hypothetical protein
VHRSQSGIVGEARHLTGQLLRQPTVVLIEEGDQIPAAARDPRHTGPRRAVRAIQADEGDAIGVAVAERFDALRGGVRRAVVDHHEAPEGMGLTEDALDRLGHPALARMSRKDDVDGQLVGRHDRSPYSSRCINGWWAVSR